MVTFNFYILVVLLMSIFLNWSILSSVLSGSTIVSWFFMFIVSVNYVGLVPYSATLSSLFWGNFILSIALWFSFLIMGMLKNSTYFFSLLLPFSSPKILWPFLVLLELVSLLIRPLTLSLRLACNMITGHVLLFLMMNTNMIISILLSLMLMFELCIATIQAVVYSMLLNMYLKDYQ